MKDINRVVGNGEQLFHTHPACVIFITLPRITKAIFTVGWCWVALLLGQLPPFLFFSDLSLSNIKHSCKSRSLPGHNELSFVLGFSET